MKMSLKSLIPGIILMLLPRIYYHFVSEEGGIVSILAIFSVAIGAILIIYSLVKKDNYKVKEIKNGKVFEIKSLYITPWKSRVGITFKEGENQYFISPIPEELTRASCGEKYCKRKNEIVKIN